MIYEYLCKNCNQIEEVEASIQDGPPLDVKCNICGKKMERVWGNSAIHIPEYFKSTSEELSPHELGNRLNSKRPSGKKRIYY